MDNDEIVEKLNRLYWTDQYGYQSYLSKLKNAGYTIKRNSKGEHKVEGGMFNVIFGQIFGGKN
jgi:hypothetical protein